jgi:hypothetical protein
VPVEFGLARVVNVLDGDPPEQLAFVARTYELHPTDLHG